MWKKAKEFGENCVEFTKTYYYKEFLRIFCISFAILLFLVGLAFYTDIRIFIVAFTMYVILIILYWRRYYQTVVTAVLKIERIKEKYSLIDAEKMTDYVSSLHVILDLIDSSLEREYSNRLLQKQAEFDAMKSQINPHFLYNTLDTIRGYAMIEQAPLTSDMIEVLSRLFRYTISQKNELITLRQELSIIYDYIKIQEYRINQHIVFLQKMDYDFQVMDYKIPKLIIQPFIENAIKHGLKGMIKDFTITLSVYRTQTRLIISIADNGSGMSPEKLNILNVKLSQDPDISVHILNEDEKGSGTGIALVNVNSRIKLIFGSTYGVIAYSTLGSGSEFQISLPYPNDLKGRILS